MRGARLVSRIALVLLGIGCLLIAFVAYQLWGTALYEHHAQAQLRQELKSTYGIKGENTRESPRAPDHKTVTSRPADSPAPQVAQPAVGQPIGLMSIPQIGLTDDAIVQGTGEGQLEEGPGHYSGTPLPGEPGNAAIAGHRTTYAHPFYDLNVLQPGDLIYFLTPQGSFEYVVSYSKIVAPNNVSVLDSSTTPEVTLTTCNPRYSATSRLVVVATLESSITSADVVSSSGSSEPKGSSSKQHRPSLADPVTAPGTLNQIGQAIIWGALTLLFTTAAWLMWRRFSGMWGGLTLALGTPAVVVGLLICFQHISLALPETF